MDLAHSLVIPIALLLVWCTSVCAVQSIATDVWLLEHNYTSYAYSKVTFTVVALRPDGRHVDELHLSTKTVISTYPLPIVGYSLGIGKSGRIVCVVHNSYITFIDLVIGVAKTDLFPDADRPLSGFIVDLTKDHATCGWISTNDAGLTKGEIVCVDPANANYSRCDESQITGYLTHSIGSSDGASLYALTSSAFIAKYELNTPLPRCPTYLYQKNPKWGSYPIPRKAWFSYDDSRIFLDNGLTLTASEEGALDLQVHGAFNGTFYQQVLIWVDQDTKSPQHTVIALTNSYNITARSHDFVIQRYTWPFLEGLSAPISIPIPAKPAGLKVSTDTFYNYGSQAFFYHSSTQIIAVVNYTTAGSRLYAPGIAYIELGD